jgi:hypothetical protein
MNDIPSNSGLLKVELPEGGSPSSSALTTIGVWKDEGSDVAKNCDYIFKQQDHV